MHAIHKGTNCCGLSQVLKLEGRIGQITLSKFGRAITFSVLSFMFFLDPSTPGAGQGCVRVVSTEP